MDTCVTLPESLYTIQITLRQYKLLWALINPLSPLLLLASSAPFKHNYFGFRGNKLFVMSDQASKQPTYIRQFISAEKCLKRTLPKEKKNLLQKGNSRGILYFSAVQQYSLPTPTLYTFRALFFLCCVFWGYIGQTSLVPKSSIHVDMILDVFFFLACPWKSNCNTFISLTCKERDINPLFNLFRNWWEHKNIQVVE